MTPEEWKRIWDEEERTARIIEWEFPGFSVENCFDRLLRLQSVLETDGKIEGTTHRFRIFHAKPEVNYRSSKGNFRSVDERERSGV